MTTKRKCYQCGDEDMATIQARRNEEIRAYGRKVLEDADAAFAAEKAETQTNEISDWDFVEQVISVEQSVSSTTEEGTEKIMDATAATEPQETEELQKKIDASPKPASQANDESEEDVEVGDKLTGAEGAEKLAAALEVTQTSATTEKTRTSKKPATSKS